MLPSFLNVFSAKSEDLVFNVLAVTPFLLSSEYNLLFWSIVHVFARLYLAVK